MKRIIIFIAIVANFASCTSDDEAKVDPLIGSWELNDIQISDPPSGYSFKYLETKPKATILNESQYVIEFFQDKTYKREMEDAKLISNGSPIVKDIEDEGNWSLVDGILDLDQKVKELDDIPTRFSLVKVNDRSLNITTTDKWFAWPPSIVDSLDTITSSEVLDSLGNKYLELIDATFTLEFDKD